MSHISELFLGTQRRFIIFGETERRLTILPCLRPGFAAMTVDARAEARLPEIDMNRLNMVSRLWMCRPYCVAVAVGEHMSCTREVCLASLSCSLRRKEAGWAAISAWQLPPTPEFCSSTITSNIGLFAIEYLLLTQAAPDQSAISFHNGMLLHYCTHVATNLPSAQKRQNLHWRRND